MYWNNFYIENRKKSVLKIYEFVSDPAKKGKMRGEINITVKLLNAF